MAHRSFKLPNELDALLVERAVELDRSVSWVIVRALESALGDAESVDASHSRSSGRRESVGSSAPYPAPTRASEPYKLPPSAPTPKPAVPKSREGSSRKPVPGVRMGKGLVAPIPKKS